MAGSVTRSMPTGNAATAGVPLRQLSSQIATARQAYKAKSPTLVCRAFLTTQAQLSSLDVRSLLAFWALRNFEAYFLTFLKGLETCLLYTSDAADDLTRV